MDEWTKIENHYQLAKWQLCKFCTNNLQNRAGSERPNESAEMLKRECGNMKWEQQKEQSLDQKFKEIKIFFSSATFS